MTDPQELSRRLRDFALAYGEDIFPPVTSDERHRLGSGLISRASAEMGRHFSKFAVEAANALDTLVQERDAQAARIAEMEKELRSIAEGNLGDLPWQTSYDKIRAHARKALANG